MTARSYKQGEIGNFWALLRKKFKKLYNLLRPPLPATGGDTDAQDGSSTEKAVNLSSEVELQTKITDAFQKLPTCSDKQFKFEIVKLVALHNISFQLVQSPQFKAMLEAGGCKVAPPGKDTLARNIVEVYLHCKTLLSELINKSAHSVDADGDSIPHLHLNCDFWTVRHTRASFGTVLLDVVSENFVLYTRTVATAAHPSDHSSENMMEWLEYTIHKMCGIGLKDVLSFTSDGADNMKKLFDKLLAEQAWCHCMAHRMNLCISHAVSTEQKAGPESNHVVRPFLKAVRQQIKAFGSTNMKKRLLAAQPAEHAVDVVKAVPTRWLAGAEAKTRLLSHRSTRACQPKQPTARCAQPDLISGQHYNRCQEFWLRS